jgi:hypothetical protein
LQGLHDCNDASPNLCEQGADFIRNNRQHIIDRYLMHSYQFAKYLDSTTSKVVFLIEPDFYQYYSNANSNNNPLSGSEMRSLFDDISKAIKLNLPNAFISWDISPWANDMSTWWSYFADSSDINYIHTSGGQNHGDLSTIQTSGLTWSYMSSLTDKKIIADSGTNYNS